MRLPNRDQAYVPSPKLNSYLLSETHTVGKSKAKFFRAFGFTETNVDVLEQGLLTIAQTEPVIEVLASRYGTKYIIEGSLETPSGVVVKVRTVWIIETGDQRPRFVTAHPA
jgi:hypothetical protein